MKHIADIGGTPDNVYDNAVALTQALNPDPHSGQCTELDAGIYKFTNPLYLGNANGPISPKLCGQGRGATVLRPTNPSAPMFIIGNNGAEIRDFELSGLSVEWMNGQTNPYDSVYFLMRNVKGMVIRDCNFRQTRTLAQVGINGWTNALVQDIHFQNCKADAAPISFYGGQPLSAGMVRVENVSGLWIRDCSINPVGNQTGILFTCQGQTTVDTVVVAQTLIKDGLSAVRAGNGTASNVFFNGCIFDKCVSTTVHLEVEADRVLTNWSFVGNWHHSQNYNYLVVQKPGGQMIRGKYVGDIFDNAASPLHKVALAGSPDFTYG